MYSYGPPHMAVQKQEDQHEHTFSNYVRIRDAVQKTCLRRWTIGRSGERGSRISVLPARHDDDDDDIYIYIYIEKLNKTSFSYIKFLPVGREKPVFQITISQWREKSYIFSMDSYSLKKGGLKDNGFKLVLKTNVNLLSDVMYRYVSKRIYTTLKTTIIG